MADYWHYASLGVVCLLTTLTYMKFWNPSLLEVALLNSLVIGFSVPSYFAWNFLPLKSILVKPPPVTDTEAADDTLESQDDALCDLPAQRTAVRHGPNKLEIELQATPLVFGEVLPKGCDEPRLVSETSRSLCLSFAKTDSVILVKIIRMTDEAWQDGAVNEVFISRALQELRKKNATHRTTGFCRRKLAVFVRDHVPKQVLLARQREYQVHADLREHFFTKHRFDELSDFLYFEYASGGEQLMNVQFQDTKQVASVVAQVAFTIAVAESAIEFEHRHLEMDAIMVSTTHETHVEFRLNGRAIKVPTYGMVSKISSIGKARARVNGDTYFSDLAKRLADPVVADTVCWFGYGFALGQLHSDWSQYKPLTNVIYLAQTLGDLVFNLENETEYEREQLRPFLDLRYALLTMKYDSMISVVQNCREFRDMIP